MAITRAQQVRQMLREGTDPRIVPILAETEDTDDAGLDMSPFLYDDFQQRARPGFNLAFAKELGLAGLTAAKKLPPVQFVGKVLSGLGSFRTKGQARGRDTAFVDGEVQIKINNFTSLYTNASYTAFERGSDYSFGGGIRIKF